MYKAERPLTDYPQKHLLAVPFSNLSLIFGQEWMSFVSKICYWSVNIRQSWCRSVQKPMESKQSPG